VAETRFGQFKVKREFGSLHEAHIFLGRGCVREIDVKEITQESSIAKYCRIIAMSKIIEDHLLYLLTISFDSTTLRKYGFHSEVADVYSELLCANIMFEESKPLTVRFLLNASHHVLSHLTQFRTELQYNVPDYGAFYAGHPREHFFQLGDYPIADLRPKVQVSGSPTLNDWSEYTTIYEFGCVYEHEVEERHRKLLNSEPLNLRVMIVPEPKNRSFIEFLKKPDDRNIRFNTEDQLTINYSSTQRSEKQN
jgi:hypothetical protein